MQRTLGLLRWVSTVSRKSQCRIKVVCLETHVKAAITIWLVWSLYSNFLKKYASKHSFCSWPSPLTIVFWFTALTAGGSARRVLVYKPTLKNVCAV